MKGRSSQRFRAEASPAPDSMSTNTSRSLAPGLADLPNVVLLPHLGSATTKVRARMAELCAANAIAIAEGDIPPHCVNPEAMSDS